VAKSTARKEAITVPDVELGLDFGMDMVSLSFLTRTLLPQKAEHG